MNNNVIKFLGCSWRWKEILPPSFVERNPDYCHAKCLEKHDWEVIFRLKDGNAAIAICKNCALLESGWMKNND
jgi:hypothetical protein